MSARVGASRPTGPGALLLGAPGHTDSVPAGRCRTQQRSWARDRSQSAQFAGKAVVLEGKWASHMLVPEPRLQTSPEQYWIQKGGNACEDGVR